MENMMAPSPDEASRALTEADDARTRLAEGQVLPSFFYTSIGAGVAVQIATTAASITATSSAKWALPLGGLAIFGGAAAIQLARFRRLNGVWVAGLVSRLVLGTGTLTSLLYGSAMGAALWSMVSHRSWLMVLCALAGGSAYAYSGHRWLRTYRKDPAAHAHGEPAWWLAAVCVLAIGAGAALLVGAR